MSGQPRPESRPVAVDIFCGAGGMSLGFEQAGFDVLAAVDNDPVHLATYSYNFPTTTPVCEEASQLEPETLTRHARTGWNALHPGETWDGRLDCVFGGPSCQGFSSIGKRDPADQRNGLIRVFAELVVSLEPRYFVMENVPGILQPHNRATLQEALLLFECAGYALVGDEALVLDASSFGVPQVRRRVFVIGAKRGEPLPIAPTKRDAKVTVSEALDDLVDADLYEELLSSDSVRLEAAVAKAIDRDASPYVRDLRRSPSLPSTISDLQRPRAWDPRQLTCSGRTVHSEQVRKRFMDTLSGGEETVARLPRLNGRGQATTLRAGTGRDHGSFTSARPIHHRYHRVITVREAARLHSFPDWFRFHTTKWHGFRQVGNSVPPALARAAASVIVAAQAKEIPPPSEPLSLGNEDLLKLSLGAAADRLGIDRAILPPDSRRRVIEDQGRRDG